MTALAGEKKEKSSKNLSHWWYSSSGRTQDFLLTGLIALIALAPRLPGLDVFLTADEPKSWFGRSIQFLDALARFDWAATFDSPAPGVTTMWAGAIGLLLEYARQGFPGGSMTAFLAEVPFDPLAPTILPLIRLPIVLIAALTAVLTYLWGRSFLGRVGAFLAATFLALDPFLLALSRILGHDALVAIFMWLSLLAFLRAINPSQLGIHNSQFTIHNSPLINRRFIIISGVLGGLAFLTKYPSLSLGAFIAVAMLILHLRSRQPWPQALRAWVIDLLLWSVAAGLVFIILWPVMWVQPLATVQAIMADALRASSNPHPKGSFFLGQPVPDPGATFYLLVTLFKTTPLLWLGWLLVIVSPIYALRDRQSKGTQGQVLLVLLAFAFFYGLLVTIGGKKQDRYILPAFPALSILAALGYTQFFFSKIRAQNAESAPTRIANRQYPGYPGGHTGHTSLISTFWLLPIVIILQLALVLPTYPYYFTYYNPLLGGGRAAARTMIVGWGEGLDAAARWLNAQPDVDTSEVVAWYSTTFEPYFKGHAIYKVGEEKISRTPKPGLAADYLILYVNQIQREIPSVGALQYFRAVEPLHIISLDGIDYAWIYPSAGLQHVIKAEARLVGQAELLGYNLFDYPGYPGGHKGHTETNAPVTELPADQTTLIQLYWEWQGKAPDEPIGLSLVDGSGRIWGWGNPLGTQARFPFEAWQEGMVAYDEFALVIFPGTPPGDYYLNVWIDRPRTDEVVGVFPLSPEDVRIPVVRPTAPPAIANLDIARALNVSLAEGTTLLGLNGLEKLQAPWQPGQSRDLLIYWRADRPPLTPQRGEPDLSHPPVGGRGEWPVRLTLEDETGFVRAEWAGSPAGGLFPTQLWEAGDVIRDPWTLTLPPYIPPGEYRLRLRLGEGEALFLTTVPVEGRPRSFDVPALNLPIEAQFGPAIMLLGLQAPLNQSAIAVRPGQTLSLALVWRSLDLVDTDYTITVQLLDGQNQVRAQRDAAPLDGAAPTTSWAVGEVVLDEVMLQIPVEIEPGPHRLLIALYRPETGERLLLSDGEDHIEIPVVLR